MGKIFYVMGKSSSGKDSIYRRLVSLLPFLKTYVLYTTRPMREGETEGVEYHFIDNAKLHELIEEKRVIELRKYDTIHGVWSYCTVNDGQFDNNDVYISIGTLESYVSMKEYLGESKIVPIYIEVDDITRLERAVGRERKQETLRCDELCRRFLADSTDFSEEKLEKAGIKANNRFVNGDMKDCIMEIVSFITSNLFGDINKKAMIPTAEDISAWGTRTQIIYSCSNCGASFRTMGDSEHFCHKCGTEVNWNVLKHFSEPAGDDWRENKARIDALNKEQLGL